ncbi:TonB-dependent receptor domain-containing protein [Phenylobacterium sp.]|uniref:TonB-dependent receptor family protein n=1 Tax=Phenylobacterium sp. TaxID=1871053 RepID=UPI00272FCF63|nr:TonB-dependent receptor [Phenylobacterium sp.]MDP1615935.1 TonB-dependent receptor [Phenylobacterium sp.]MDP1988710.1 TonB-dependent receptor [Phenylobacterium sp.]
MPVHRLTALLCGVAVSAMATSSAWAETLDDGAAPLLDAVLVTGSTTDSRDLGGSVQVLDAETLSTFAYSDVNRILRQAPGVYLQEEEGFGLRPNIGIRGSGSDRNSRITVMEDGVLIAPAPYAAPAAYYFPRMTRIAAVEVSKGPAAIKYGPLTVGGALNLFSTPIPDVEAGKLSGRLDILAGDYGGRRALGSVGGWAGLGGGWQIGGLIEGLYEASDGFKSLDNGGDTGFEITDGLVKIGLRSDDGRHQWEAKYQRYDETSDETYLGLTLADFTASPYRRYNGSGADVMNVDHETFQLTHRFQISPNVSLTTLAYHHETARAWYKLNDVRNTANTGWVGIGAVVADPVANAVQMADLIGAPGVTGRAGALRVRNNNRLYSATGVQTVVAVDFDTGAIGHGLEFSVRHHRDEEDRFQQDDRYTMVDGAMVLASAGAPGSQENRLGEARAWSFFLRDEMSFGALTLTPGLRYETIRLKRTNWSLTDPARTAPTGVIHSDVDVWIPGVSATWRVSPEVLLLAGAHRGFANPGPGSTAEAETSWSYEAGARWTRGGWKAEAIAFLNDYDNLVGTCTASTGGGCNIGDQFDGGAVEVRGLEVTASNRFGDLATRGFAVPVSLAYTLTDAEFKSSFASAYGPWGAVVAGDELPYLPEHQINLTIGLELSRLTLTSGFNWVAEARETAGSGPILASEKIDERLVIDLAAEYALTPNFALFGTVQNLADETYNVSFSPAGARPGAPRLVMAGVRARF